jgi:hypothetical protein
VRAVSGNLVSVPSSANRHKLTAPSLADEEYTAKFVPAGSGVAPIGVGWPGRTCIGAGPPTVVTDCLMVNTSLS